MPQFNNFGSTHVGQQIGATGAVFNNHAGGKFYIIFLLAVGIYSRTFNFDTFENDTSKLSFSDILGNDFWDHSNNFGVDFYTFGIYSFKNDTFESAWVDAHGQNSASEIFFFCHDVENLKFCFPRTLPSAYKKNYILQ